ncbi:Uncharacterised protein at_DN2267, partial [Pycnogonum litorale]
YSYRWLEDVRKEFRHFNRSGKWMEKGIRSELKWREVKFNYYDINKDSLLQFSEYFKMKRIKESVIFLHDPKVRATFKRFLTGLTQKYCHSWDTGKFRNYNNDENGKIDKKEFTVYFTETRGKPKDETAEEQQATIDILFDKADFNRDGFLSIQYEFELFCLVDSFRNLMLEKFDTDSKLGLTLREQCDEEFQRKVARDNKHSITVREFSDIATGDTGSRLYTVFRSISRIIKDNVNYMDSSISKRDFTAHCINQRLYYSGGLKLCDFGASTGKSGVVASRLLKFDLHFRFRSSIVLLLEGKKEIKLITQ